MRTLLKGGEPFYFQGGPVGCVLVHGFTGAPEEMLWLGEYLADRGSSVLGVRLFGHGTQPEDMLRARWEDWIASVEDGYYLLQESCEQIIVLGLSLGGALSLYVASQLPLTGVVAMSTPFVTPDARVSKLRPILPLISTVWRFAQKDPSSDWHDAETADTHLSYNVQPVRAAVELDDLLREMRARLPHIQVPALLIHSRQDGAVPPEHAQQIFDQLQVRDKELLWLENSGHVVTRDAAREQVFHAAAQFISRVTEPGA